MPLVKKIKAILRGLTFWIFYKNLFNDFQFYIANDPQEIKDIYRLRYQVYCEEYGYIDKEKHPDGMETDKFDKHSSYLVIRDKQNIVAATVRIIHNSPEGFPIQEHFKFNIDTSKIDNEHLVEISRLIVAKKYRRKHLIVFLLKGLSVYAINKKVSHAYCVIDEKLYPLLRKLSVPVRIIGDKQLYQGVTFPCIIVISEWIEEVRKNRILRGFFTYKGFTFEKESGKYLIH